MLGLGPPQLNSRLLGTKVELTCDQAQEWKGNLVRGFSVPLGTCCGRPAAKSTQHVMLDPASQ
jgi:hypothetical protein